ncbi:MAG: ABC transporter ATP-binding protein [Alphaproteobacteria bacterium]
MQVTLEKIHKSFGPVEVVKGLDLQVEEGEFLVLLGPSGCGKTTVLRMMAGLEEVSAGRILIGSRDVTNMLPKYRDVAMVFQSYALYPHMTVAQNIGYPLRLRKIAAAEQRPLIVAAAEKVHMTDYLDRYPRQLSGGQRQRVALARAIIRQPVAFLMDEPLSNLDAKLRGYMRAELKQLQHGLGTTTIYVTHDQIEAMTLAHRVAVMDGGVMQQIGAPKQIYNDPANLFVAGFIGAPAMNFVAGELVDGAFQSPAGSIKIAGYAPVKNATLGFRSEASQVVDAAKGHVRGEVFSTEMTGSETIVAINVGEAQVVVSMDADFAAAAGTAVGIKIDPGPVCLFDADTGLRLRPK